MRPLWYSKVLIGSFLLCLGFAGCKKEETLEDWTKDTKPVITGVQASPGSVAAYTQSVSLVVTYRDGDGDLGQNQQGVENLFVKDPRTGSVTAYRIPQLAADGGSYPIEGNIKIEIKALGLTQSSTSEKVKLEVYLKDRKGNVSNTQSSNEITIAP